LCLRQDRLETTRITFPVADQAGLLENALARDRRAVLMESISTSTARPSSRSPTANCRRCGGDEKNPDWTLNVEGHTDNIGGDSANQDLSSRRAAAVRTALIELGIPSALRPRRSVLRFRATNSTLAGRARNRRVELTRQ
jgi:hypothetical protein